MYEELRSLPLRGVLEALGFSTWKERQNGELYGACPIHQPKRNSTSFSFSPDGKFHCFSCGSKGKGAIDLVKVVRGCSFKQAVDFLSSLQGGVQRSPVRAVEAVEPEKQLTLTQNPEYKASYEKFYIKSTWLKERSLSEQTLKHYEVGEYHNPARRSVYSGCVMLKIRRYSDGECVGYLVRNIGEITPAKPKYLFPKGVQKGLELFGAWQLKNEANLPIRVVYLVESPFSVLRFHQLGYPAVSPFGWSVSDAQAEILSHLARGCIFLPDRNKYQESISVAGKLSQVMWTKQPELPAGIDDPEHLNAEQIRLLTGAS